MSFYITQGSGTAEEEKCEAVAADPEAEAWTERTAVITRYDHETHCDLARGFVEDLADKVVAENWNKEPEPTKEKGSKPPSSLNLKKQLLFLPDLVPNVVISQTPTTDTVSESDEYESADEQPQLHGIHNFCFYDLLTMTCLQSFLPSFRDSLSRFDCQSVDGYQRVDTHRLSWLAIGF